MEGVSFGRGKSVRSYAVDARGRVRVASIGRRGGGFPFAYREGAKKRRMDIHSPFFDS